MKRIESNLERWKGNVVLFDPLPLVKLVTFEEAVKAALLADPKLGSARSHMLIIPALIECVAEWHIEGFPEKPTAETFPGMGTGISKVDITQLINFITSELMKFLRGDDDPND